MSKPGILKTPDGTPRSCNRVQFRVPLSVKTTLSDYVKGNDNRLYQETVSLIKDNHIEDEDLLALLKEVRSLVSILDKKLKLFVQVFLLIPWAHRDGAVVEEYQNFLLDLLAAHNYYVEFAFDVLVKNFRKVDQFAGEDDPVPTVYERTISANVQKVLRDILKVIPLSQHFLIKQCQLYYPYTCLPAREQELYLGNLLALTKHQPSLRFPLLKIIFAKMILLDINSPLEEVIAMEEDEDDDEEDEVSKANDDATTTISASLMGGPLLKRTSTEGMRHPLANTLDRKMVRLFSFIDSECSSNAEGNEANSLAVDSIKESESSSEDSIDHCKRTGQGDAVKRQIDWTAANCLFEEMKEGFSYLILPTHGSHHIQFLIFYMAAGGLSREKNIVKGQQWLRFAESFISLLWGRGSNPNISLVERMAALGYLSSFLARSKCLPLRMIKAMLGEICSWIHAYISRQDYTEGGALTRECANRNHSVFNAVCHSLFYVIAFRHIELSKTSEDITFLQSLKLPAIVTSSLNPLKTCAAAIARRFASAVEALQLAYCTTVIEANSRDTIPVENGTIVTPTISLIFPFDRYILTRSSPSVVPYLLEYCGEVEEMAVDDVDDASGAEDMDEFMEISGNRVRKHNTSISSEFFGTSPGLMDL